jgi:hypothetical protein
LLPIRPWTTSATSCSQLDLCHAERDRRSAQRWSRGAALGEVVRQPPQHALVCEPVESSDDLARARRKAVEQQLRQGRTRTQCAPERVRRQEQRAGALHRNGARRIRAAAEQRDFAEEAAGPLTMHDHGAPFTLTDDPDGARKDEVHPHHRVSRVEQPLVHGELDGNPDPRASLQHHVGNATAETGRILIGRTNRLRHGREGHVGAREYAGTKVPAHGGIPAQFAVVHLVVQFLTRTG